MPLGGLCGCAPLYLDKEFTPSVSSGDNTGVPFIAFTLRTGASPSDIGVCGVK